MNSPTAISNLEQEIKRKQMITSLLNILLLCGFNHAVSGNFLRENVLNLKDGVNVRTLTSANLAF